MSKITKYYLAVDGNLDSSGGVCVETEIFDTHEEALLWLYDRHWHICCENRDIIDDDDNDDDNNSSSGPVKLYYTKDGKIDYKQMFEKCDNCNKDGCHIDHGSNGQRFCYIQKFDLDKNRKTQYIG